MGKYTLVTPPTVQAVSTEFLKEQLKIESSFTDDDSLIDEYIKAATNLVEDKADMLYMEQTWQFVTDSFEDVIILEKMPLTSVDHIKYYDSSNALVTLDSAEYVVITKRVPGRIEIEDTPSTYVREDAVEIQFVVGTDDGANLRPITKQLITWAASEFYLKRLPFSQRNDMVMIIDQIVKTSEKQWRF